MKRIAVLMLLSCALVMVSRLSHFGPYSGQVVADEDGGDGGSDDDEDSGT